MKRNVFSTPTPDAILLTVKLSPISAVLTLQHETLKDLNSLSVSFFNLDVYANGIADTNSGMSFFR
ncbi:hypothetical protein BHK98_00070 [Hornefia porci]|uniref:Uncharacterized protein n=1 Tax=Hornefia porci TaxID=2652292 RepID=A0A1Q9JER8_9FIRM|nr:hypothetical protein BHK98_00070 [Hornefia porci]